MVTLTNSQTVRIRWGDCDPAGIIFYPRYFEIFDHATATLFERALGVTKLQMFKSFEFAGFPLVRTQARFVRPTRFGDDVVVHSSIAFGRSSFEVAHRLSLEEETCVECFETRVWVMRDPANSGRFKARPIPREVLEKFRV
jgi:4-hydroxybenzoyl-CoA thioesterase